MDDGVTGVIEELRRYDEDQELRAFFKQEAIDLSEGFVERFEAFRAGIRASEDRWIINHCVEKYTLPDGTRASIINPSKVMQRMQRMQRMQENSFRNPFE